MLNISFLTCTKVELKGLIVCIVVNGESCDIANALELTLLIHVYWQNHSGIVMFTYSIYEYLKNTAA